VAKNNGRADSDETVGQRLKAALAGAGQPAAWLAERAGIELPTVYSILNSHQQPSLDKLRRLCRALNVSADWVLELEADAFYDFPREGAESLTYAQFEETFLGERGGERISVSRCFSIVDQPLGLRRQILRELYRLEGPTLDKAMEAFLTRKALMARVERRRVEYVVASEVEDFLLQRSPWDRVDSDLVEEFARSIIKRLDEEPLALEVVLIPRQCFVVNYEILNRQAVVLDLGTLFLRQAQPRVVEHFVREVGGFHRHPESVSDRQAVIDWLEDLLARRGPPVHSRHLERPASREPLTGALMQS
jgi:transcriptional regulator with XRE-family HTH domain